MTVRIGVRHWDHVVPLALGDVPTPGLDVVVRRLDTTPDLWGSAEHDVAETSFSRYVRARAAGDDRVVALPLFVMRAFRQRCIVVRRDAAFEAPQDLHGARVGVTGWADSGTTWTRAVLRDAGVGVDDVEWRVGRLTGAHPHFDRIGVGVGDNVRPTRDDDTLVGLLETGELDAVMTPFMPPGFHAPGSLLRPLFRDPRAAELEHYARHGFIPGIHLVAVQASLLDARPSLPQQLVDAFQRAKQLSFARRTKLVDVTPWHNEEVAATARVFGADWLPYGPTGDREMVGAFVEELVAQRLLTSPPTYDELFPHRVEPTVTVPEEVPA